jgi:hypothetical protein
MDSTSLKQIPKFDGERKHFAVWLMKATAVCALSGVGPTLKPGFKDMLPVNDAIPVDSKKPDEFQFILNKNANDKIKYKHCGRLEHKKETCWKQEENKSIKRPEWWMDTATVSVDDGKVLL